MTQVPNSQEVERISRGVPLAVMLAVIAFSTLLCFVARRVLSLRADTHSHATGSPVPVRPEPEVSGVRAQLIDQAGAGQVLQDAQRAALQHYGWVDRQRGIVRIPIDVAIALESEGKP